MEKTQVRQVRKMARPVKCRRVCALPQFQEFGPGGGACTGQVEMGVDEYEAVRLIDHLGLSQEEAAAEALRWVNQVGYSEHQSGLAVDINADGIHSAGYEVYDWLAQNAWRYGFILRYPEDKTEVTGTGYEPWHYRYVGQDAARVITEQGLCLEEYLGQA